MACEFSGAHAFEAADTSASSVKPRQEEMRATKIPALRQLITKLDARSGLAHPSDVATSRGPLSPWRVGIESMDLALPEGGLDRSGLHEVYGASHVNATASSGYLLALLKRLREAADVSAARHQRPVLFCQTIKTEHESGAIYGHGLQAFGLDPGNFLFARVTSNNDLLWAVEEGARSGCLSAVIGEIDTVSFTQSRRLSLSAALTGTPILLLRSHHGLMASAAVTRWCVRALPSSTCPLAPATPHHARWLVELKRCRGGRSGQWCVGWDHETHCFRLAEDISPRLPAVADTSITATFPQRASA